MTKRGRHEKGSNAPGAKGARKRRAAVAKIVADPKPAPAVDGADLDVLARETLGDLGLPSTPTRLDEARHYHELRRIIRNSAAGGTADRQLAAALGTLSKQVQHILDSLKKDASELAARGNAPPAPTSSTTGRGSPADATPAADDVKRDDWGMPVA